MQFRNTPKPLKYLEPSSDGLLRNTSEQQNLTRVKGKAEEKKGIEY